ncbi:alpha-amylase family protein [Mucilaginibacter segetis]|uniref:Alpha-galactosidase n=1 Tax=Mucilaginibacter segetis TaxID=2793071 RepID=A0A934PV79_9SPHI|nr:hypothetical protein [Mucilaginibacter segetis]MBK0379700.1 hypothetical protein [Mucilaginibacter segetis]
MDRRNFIYTSGTALASLIFTERLTADNTHLVHLPSAVYITLTDGLHHLAKIKSDTWALKDVWVKITHNNGALEVKVSSPEFPLSNIILDWHYETPTSSKVLGDHWERSYGDLRFEPANFNRKMPWYFVQHNKNSTTCFGVKTGCNSICYWQLGDGKMRLTMDTRNGGNGVNLAERVLTAAEIIATQNITNENTFYAARRFCSLMCHKPRLPEKPIYGINDWYITYGMNSADIIINHTQRMAELVTDTGNRPFSVVDSGWAKYSPLLPGDCCWQDDFSRPNEHFKDMHLLADNIKKSGMRPGLWTRPLCGAHNDKKSKLLPLIDGRNTYQKPVLDPSIPENLNQIKNTISLYKEWGYGLIKHDFTTFDILGKWGSNMDSDITTPGWNFNDKSKTTAEIILNLYHTIREGAGDTYLLGCNTLSHLSAGIFEINRIGDDTSGKEWDRTKKMGVNTLGFRMIQHGNFYAADGDCVGLTTAVPWEKNKQWMQLLALSGTPLFISAQAEATGPWQKTFIKQCFATAAQKLPVAEPLDWLTHQWPKKWKLNGKIVDFNW